MSKKWDTTEQNTAQQEEGIPRSHSPAEEPCPVGPHHCLAAQQELAYLISSKDMKVAALTTSIKMTTPRNGLY